MKKSKHLSLVLAACITAHVSLFGMNNADLIKMKKADLSDDTLLLSIDKQPADYDTSPEGLIELKKAGISEAVIKKIVALNNSKPAAPASSSGSSSEAKSADSASASDSISTGTDYGATDLPVIAPAFVQPAAGQDYFTRFTFHVEKSTYVTTNYSRGDIVPINTPVKLVSLSGSKIVLKRIDTGAELKVDNVEKYSKKSVAEVARLMLAAEKTPIEKLPTELANDIRQGEMRRGMTKELVLMARGYPPAHETPSLDGDRWVFWSSRFVKQTIVFRNGRLVEGRNLL
jgi:hypothetical protein